VIRTAYYLTGDRGKIQGLASVLHSIGFSCRKCGECCTEISEASNLVMIMPDEVKAIMNATGLAWDNIAVPYPEFLEGNAGTRYTFGWCIRREDNQCIFLKAGKCSIYQHRPTICRTYPFMLSGDDIVISACPGTGTPIDFTKAERLAEELVRREYLERADEELVRKVWSAVRVPEGETGVIDSRGVSILNG